MLGKLKDELNGKILAHFIGLKPKSYCYKVYGEDKEHKKSKGVVKHQVHNQLSYEKHEETLNKQLNETVPLNSITSMTIKSTASIKPSTPLAPSTTKDFGTELESLPYGHYLIDDFKVWWLETYNLIIPTDIQNGYVCKIVSSSCRFYLLSFWGKESQRHWRNQYNSHEKCIQYIKGEWMTKLWHKTISVTVFQNIKSCANIDAGKHVQNEHDKPKVQESQANIGRMDSRNSSSN